MTEEKKSVFNELNSLNLNDATKRKKTLTYLPWAEAWEEVCKIYPLATYKIQKDENNKCFFGDGLMGYMVFTSVTIENLTHSMWLPVLDGANKAMKVESYQYKTKYDTRTVEACSIFDINKAIMRCLTKNIAMFGLGLYIYRGEDLPSITEEEGVSPSETALEFVKKFPELTALLKAKGLSRNQVTDIVKKVGFDEKKIHKEVQGM